MDPTPPLAVLMPLRDAERHLEEAIESVCAQTFRDFEIVAVDDGSTDGTFDILHALARSEPRLRIFRSSSPGIVGALNEGIKHSRGDLIARMDGDDISDPNRFALQVEALLADPRLAAVGANYQVMDENGIALRDVDLPQSPILIREVLLRSNCMAHPAMMIRRGALLAVGGYRDLFPQCEDYDLWLRLSERFDIANLPSRLLRYREHQGQLSWRNLEVRLESEARTLSAAKCRRAGRPEQPVKGVLLSDAVAERALLAAQGALADRKEKLAAELLRIARRRLRLATPWRTLLRWARLQRRATAARRADEAKVRATAPRL